MKKLVLFFAVAAAVSFAACNTKPAEATEEVVDTCCTEQVVDTTACCQDTTACTDSACTECVADTTATEVVAE